MPKINDTTTTTTRISSSSDSFHSLKKYICNTRKLVLIPFLLLIVLLLLVVASVASTTTAIPILEQETIEKRRRIHRRRLHQFDPKSVISKKNHQVEQKSQLLPQQQHQQTNVTNPTERWGPYCDPRTINSYRPSQNRKVYVVSFAGWNEERYQNALLLAKRVRQRGYIPLIYTEKDLPQEYYNDFAWAFTKPSYRGFWTWKPWILRNVTSTILEEGDLLFYMDSDRMIYDWNDIGSNSTAINGDSNPPYDYFQVVLCNLEHRTHNPEGILAFHRCNHHTEQEFTKPQVFDLMNLSREEYGMGEQLYAGALGLIKRKETTVQFLQEWQDYGQYHPVAFGDESFRDENKNFTRPTVYKGHRNDQSVFSLMVRSRRFPEIELWPAPYLAWDTGLEPEQCFHRFQNAGYCVFFPEPTQGHANFVAKSCQPFTNWLKSLPESPVTE